MANYPFTDEEEARYWAARRFQLLEQMEADEKALNAKLADIYESQEALLKREIAAYYAQYGEDKVIEYRKLLSALSPDDRRLLMERMDEFAKKYPQYAHLMPVRESIYQLDRLEGLQYSIWLQQMEIGAIEQDELNAHFALQAQRAANLAAEELGFGANFYAINAPIILATVGAAWSQGENFSQRIWNNRGKLAAFLNDDLAKGFARGLKYDEMAKLLTERFDGVSKRDAMRLIYTEGTFLFNESQAQVHEQSFEYYQLSTITDPKTCEICKGVEEAQKSEPIAFKDRKPGVNFPPLHPNCRCSYVVAVEDWDDWIEREVARNGGDYIQERDRPDLNYLHPESTRQSGAIVGALNNSNDPTGNRRNNHARLYYEEVRKRNPEHEAEEVSRNTGIEKSVVLTAFSHLFLEKHRLDGGMKQFDADYGIAQSWQRLRDGKNIQPHDITLINHERYEAELMNQGMSYDEAHREAERLYNYKKELEEFESRNG